MLLALLLLGLAVEKFDNKLNLFVLYLEETKSYEGMYRFGSNS